MRFIYGSCRHRSVEAGLNNPISDMPDMEIYEYKLGYGVRVGKCSMPATAVQRMQKSMELMNVKLTEVISNIVGLSGIRIVEGILSEERDPETLASWAAPRSKAKREDIATALEGTWDENLIFALSMAYEDYKANQSKIGQCDAKIEEVAVSMNSPVAKADDEKVKSGKRAHKKFAILVAAAIVSIC